MKKISRMTTRELMAVFEEFDLLLPETDSPTNAELRDMLQVDYGITDQKLEAFREKKDAVLDKENAPGGYNMYAEDGNGTVVICMDRKNASFQIGKYTFTQRAKYVPVDAETAERLLSEFTGFRKATREELKRRLQ